MKRSTVLCFIVLFFACAVFSQHGNPYRPDFSSPKQIPGMSLIWNDEFNNNGKPDPRYWKYEMGFVRNQELQWYQSDNANCSNGVLLIEGRRERIVNPNYIDSSKNWKLNRQYAEYTASSIKTQGLQQFVYGRLEIRARIDTPTGSWPAIWTLGVNGRWPLNGEVDIMEFYRIDNVPTILANLAWGTSEKGGPHWNTKRLAFSDFTSKDPDWDKKFHVWRMDWNQDSINLYLDDVLLNTAQLNKTLNPDGSNPFLQPHYLLLNLAIGSNGGDPEKTKFPIKYEVDYVRYYKKS
jgi:beta-glucanase (GH16 family)